MIRQELDIGLESPAVENFIEIDGQTYATGKGGRGLYMLVPPEKAYFMNEAVLISDKFVFNKKKDLENEIRTELARLGKG